jgi:hypothetical protein
VQEVEEHDAEGKKREDTRGIEVVIPTLALDEGGGEQGERGKKEGSNKEMRNAECGMRNGEEVTE